MTKKTKITYLIIIMAITTITVAFLLKSKLDKSVALPSKEEAHSHQEQGDHGHSHDHNNLDHTIATPPENSPKQNVITIGAEGVQSNAEKWNLPKFKTYINDTYKSLPNIEAVQGLKDEEVHQNPRLVMDAGLRLGTIKKQIKLNSEFEEEGIKFYDKCATKKDGLTPVRALCLANLIYMKNQRGQDFELQKYPEKVKELAQRALDLAF